MEFSAALCRDGNGGETNCPGVSVFCKPAIGPHFQQKPHLLRCIALTAARLTSASFLRYRSHMGMYTPSRLVLQSASTLIRVDC